MVRCALKLAIIVNLVGFLLGFLPENAKAVFGAGQFDISAFCDSPAARKTLVYIDKDSLREGVTDWAKRLDEKLRSNLLPHEQVSIVALDARIGSAKETWAACWPDYTQGERDKIAHNRSSLVKFVTSDPLKELKNQQTVFHSGLDKAFTTVFHEAAQDAGGGNPDSKQLVRALMADESRFSSGQDVVRVIIYSDMAENSELISGERGFQEKGKNAAQRFGFNARNAMVYVFGVAGATDGGGVSSENSRAFWQAFFHAANGYLVSFGSDLKLPGVAPSMFQIYDVEVDLPDQPPRIGRNGLRILADNDGQIQDSFLSFGDEGRAVIEGTFQCTTDNKCTLQATTNFGTITKEAGEVLRLSGTRQELVGDIGFPNKVSRKTGKPAVFRMKAAQRLSLIHI